MPKFRNHYCGVSEVCIDENCWYYYLSLKILQFHLIFWCRNYVKRHSFRQVSGNCAFVQNLYTRKLGEITVFYAVRKCLTPVCFPKRYSSEHLCGKLRELVPLVQNKKRKKHPWRSVNFSKVAG